jgi:1-acyl-sn-glycerol-3-phosphate acyltransferase
MLFQGQYQGQRAEARPATYAQTIARDNSARPGTSFGERALYQMGRSIVAAYMQLALDVDIQRQASLPRGPKILAANHPTTTDPFYILSLLSEPVSVLVAAATFDVAGLGDYLRATGHVPAIRGSGGATIEAVARQVEAGRSVAIFPEGALSPLAGGFHAPHTGVARVALHTGAPVIPVGIGLQRDRIRVIKADVQGGEATGHFYAAGPYAMTVGRPLYFEGNVQDRGLVRAVADDIMHHIRHLARESDRRLSHTPVTTPRRRASLVRAR